MTEIGECVDARCERVKEQARSNVIERTGE
jgi:hypothetical protein